MQKEMIGMCESWVFKVQSNVKQWAEIYKLYYMFSLQWSNTNFSNLEKKKGALDVAKQMYMIE